MLSAVTLPTSGVAVASRCSFARPTGSSGPIAISETLFSSANTPASSTVPALRARRAWPDSLPPLESGSLRILVRHTLRTVNRPDFSKTFHIGYREVDHDTQE
jgi:hypothetical protein